MIKVNFFRILVVFCLLFFNNNHIGAQNSIENCEDQEPTNLFEYGEPVTSGEDNFKNLFRNFPLFIENADAVDLLSYKYVGTIKNRKQAIRYVKKNIYPNGPAWGTFSAMGGTESSKSIIQLDTNQNFGSDKSEIDKMVKTLSNEYVNIADEVYVVKLVAKMVTYESFFFVNPETKKVLTKGNLFGFPIPMCHINHHEEKKNSK